MATKRTKSIADSLLPKPEAKRDLNLDALEQQVRAIHGQAAAPVAPSPPPPQRRTLDLPPAEKLYRLSIDLPEGLYFKMKETLGRRRPTVTNRAYVVSLIEADLLKDE